MKRSEENPHSATRERFFFFLHVSPGWKRSSGALAVSARHGSERPSMAGGEQGLHVSRAGSAHALGYFLAIDSYRDVAHILKVEGVSVSQSRPSDRRWSVDGPREVWCPLHLYFLHVHFWFFLFFFKKKNSLHCCVVALVSVFNVFMFRTR